jgi:hypothetical protein
VWLCAIRFAFSGAKVLHFFNMQAFWQKKVEKVFVYRLLGGLTHTLFRQQGQHNKDNTDNLVIWASAYLTPR